MLWAAVTLELQKLAGTDLRFSRVQAAPEPSVYKIVVGIEEEPLGQECLQTAGQVLSAACDDRALDLAAVLERLRELANHVRLGPSTGAIVRAAGARGIPVRRLDYWGSLVQLGHGARQHRIRAAETDATRAIAVAIASDKAVTNSLLRSLSVPVPKGRVVTSPEDAWAAADEIGLPVVVKPTDANHGRGVSINLTNREEVMRAFEAARPEGDSVLVEQFAVGAEYRLLVVAGKMVAAARAEPERVTGDGQHTVRQLVQPIER